MEIAITGTVFGSFRTFIMVIICTVYSYISLPALYIVVFS